MNSIATLLALSCLFLIGSSRLMVSINMVAFQGLLLGILPIVAAEGKYTTAVIVLALVSIVMKALVLPIMLRRALVQSGAKREIEPYISFGASIFIGILLLFVSGWIVEKLNAMDKIASSSALTVGFFLLFTGLFVIVSRRKALTQALGFLVLENGVYTAGLSLGSEFSFMVELGIMLDVFVGIFLMGIMLFHIDREFDHIDADRFDELSDLDMLNKELTIFADDDDELDESDETNESGRVKEAYT